VAVGSTPVAAVGLGVVVDLVAVGVVAVDLGGLGALGARRTSSPFPDLCVSVMNQAQTFFGWVICSSDVCWPVGLVVLVDAIQLQFFGVQLIPLCGYAVRW
jgi:hypothetical protein